MEAMLSHDGSFSNAIKHSKLMCTSTFGKIQLPQEILLKRVLVRQTRQPDANSDAGRSCFVRMVREVVAGKMYSCK